MLDAQYSRKMYSGVNSDTIAEGAVWAVGRGQTCEQVLGKLKVTEGACRGCVVVAAFVKIVLLA
eukprot:5126145-Pyramimonas_sp.AAC.1